MKKFLTAAVLVATMATVSQAAPIVISIPNNADYTRPLSWNATITGPAAETGTFAYDGGTVSLSFTPGDDVTAEQKAAGGQPGIYAARIELDANTPYQVAFGGLDPAKLYSFDLTTFGGGNTYTFAVTTGTISGGTAASQSIVSNSAVLPTEDFDPNYTVGWSITPDASGNVVFEGSGSNFRYNTLKGVRIDVVPEPATMSLLSLGGLVALRRRRRA